MERQKHSLFLIFLAVFTYLCNLFDLWYTIYVLDFVPSAREVNPAMVLMLKYPLVAVIYKYAVLPLGLYLLYRLRRYRAARWGIYLCALVFGGTVAWQILSVFRGKLQVQGYLKILAGYGILPLN